MKPDENAETIQLGEIDDRRKNLERRSSSRRKILKRGLTFWPNGDSSECTVYNLSEAGAQLEVRGLAPNLFDLVVEGDRWRRKCSVVWRKANRVGVKFQEQSPSMLPGIKQLADFKRYIEECQTMANRAAPSDRELLLEMAEAWATVIRRLQRQSREQTNPARSSNTVRL
jgi:hypothetical protein